MNALTEVEKALVRDLMDLWGAVWDENTHTRQCQCRVCGLVEKIGANSTRDWDSLADKAEQAEQADPETDAEPDIPDPAEPEPMSDSEADRIADGYVADHLDRQARGGGK